MSGTNNLENTPIRTECLGSLLEAPVTTDDNFGSRMKGWLMPPVTGDYLFWITSDDQGRLWLSSDDNPDNMVLVCFAPQAVGVGEWTKYVEQKSTFIPLVAGKAYYFEVRP
jgi:xyloglucan-specific exo-beta-1,4-glucanase